MTLQQHPRPRHHLIEIGKRYPKAWKRTEDWRTPPDWPEWCYFPLGLWLAVVCEGHSLFRHEWSNALPQHFLEDAALLEALGAWRVTQGIYRYDPALYEAIVETRIEGNLPHQILFRLPEWCVYVETPGCVWQKSLKTPVPLHGFFAQLRRFEDSGEKAPRLHLVLDTETGLLSTSLPLRPAPVSELAYATLKDPDASAADFPFICRHLEIVLSLLLYLCSENAEIGNGGIRPARPMPKRTKRGLRLFPPDQPHVWDIGVRLGAALRRGYRETESAADGGTHAGPRPHIRRAHWHGFRLGPMKRADGSEIPTAERAFELRWLPPIPVNLETPEQLSATIHPIKAPPEAK